VRRASNTHERKLRLRAHCTWSVGCQKTTPLCQVSIYSANAYYVCRTKSREAQYDSVICRGLWYETEKEMESNYFT
jgi:hypothetical protein